MSKLNIYMKILFEHTFVDISEFTSADVWVTSFFAVYSHGETFYF